MNIFPLPFLLLFSALFPAKKEDNLPLNHIQVIGSHNSYKQAIDPKLFAVLQKSDSVGYEQD